MINRPSKHFYEFDSFRIDLDERRLIRGSEPIPLSPKLFDVLLALVENNRHTVQKEDLIDRVWADTFVEDGNLNRNISTLRKILGEDSRAPRYIRTVPKFGYRFEADVHEIIEEDEELRVEKVTRVHLAITQSKESRVSTGSLAKLASNWAWPFTAAGVLALIFISAWAINREPTPAAIASSAREHDEAYELYRQGRGLWQDRTVGGLHNATILLEQAVARNPNFALGHAALADAYAFDGQLWKKAEAAAGEAIRLDPSLGQPHATIGFIRTFWDWKLSEAEPHFKRSIALSPGYATAHQWYSINLAARAQMGAALAEMQRALDLEPRSASINSDMCQLLYFARKYDAAIDQCRKTLDIDPDFLSAHTYLYEIFTAKGMYDEALDAYFRASDLNKTMPTDPTLHSHLRHNYEIGGIETFWRARIKMLLKPQTTSGYSLAKYHARLGETEEAIRSLQAAYDSRDFETIYFVADPVFESIAADPRYLGLRDQFVKQ